MPDRAGSFKRITNPDSDDDSQFVDIPIVDKITLVHGRGVKFQRRIIEFINHEQNDVRVKEPKTIIYHPETDDEGRPVVSVDDDPTQRVVYELISDYTTRHGSGVIFQRNIHKLDQSGNPDQSGRTTHVRRIHGKYDGGRYDGIENGDFIDVERIDQFSLVHGSGQIFRREIVNVVWDDEAFEDTPRAEVPLHEGPQNGFDPPWRLDPLQNIVNVFWRKPTTTGFNMTWSWTVAYPADTEPAIAGIPPSDGGTGCQPTAEGGDPYILDNVWVSGSAGYAFTPSGPPVFVSLSPYITEGNTTVSGEPSVSPDSNSFGSCVGVGGMDSGNVTDTSADISFTKAMLEGSAMCYGFLGGGGTSKFGIVPTITPFTVAVDAGGINGTFRGKAADRITTHIIWGSNTLTINVGFSWDVPVNYDFESGDPP